MLEGRLIQLETLGQGYADMDGDMSLRFQRRLKKKSLGFPVIQTLDTNVTVYS